MILSMVNSQWSIVNGQTMSNSSYILEQGNLGSFSGRATGPTKTLTDSGGTTAPGIYQGTNYIMRANFYYGAASTSSSFNFSISNTSINFGTITPGEPLVRTNNLTVSSPSGYAITAAENSSLKNSNGNTIPDTTCDTGTCTQNVSALWLSPLTYGLGYRCNNLNGTDCSSIFAQSGYFAQFANTASSETPVVVMQNETGSQSQGQITYKLNIAASQPSGTYQNTIQYIAIPSL